MASTESESTGGRIYLGGLILALFLVTATCVAAAQQPAKTARIGYLSPLSPGVDFAHREAFRQGLHALGYIEGQNTVIEARYADGKLERLPDLAAAIVRLKVDVIVAAPTTAVRAVKQATQTIPIVMAFSGDPVGERLVAGLARPGGNITGHSATVAEMAAKRVELLKTMVPGLSHVSHLAVPEQIRRTVIETEAAGRTLGVQVITMSVRDSRELDRAFSTMRRPRVDGLIVSLTLQHHFKLIGEFALKNRLPTISGPREFVEAGGLMAYGPDYPDLFRRAATYVDKILRGAKPADLPIEQPTKFDFVINGKTAKTLGLTIPPSLLLQANHIIE
ncbi:MAG TPA: ABC transporter substrate-binding protein [Methylomirabilota bacterium]|nr:ABC transporter substrate-binding protein [Methylomirabilota bacterium]